MARLLSPSFYLRDTTTVARELLGQTLVHIVDGQRISGLIVETEAYLGIEDRACHSFGDRRTPRTEVMYLPGGHTYVYFIYGMHFCFNVVTRESGAPEAVLVRAIEPLEGIEFMRARRKVKSDRDLTNGPGKLCAALAIDRSCNGLSLQSETLFIERGRAVDAACIIASPRVGVDYAEDAKHWPLRFTIEGHRCISKPSPVSRATTKRK